MKLVPQWPDVFLTGEIPADRSDQALCADALEAWALVMSGNKQLPEFGQIMATIAMRLGVIGSPESFMQWSEEHPLSPSGGDS